MEPATIAALASGAGSLLSGLGFGKSKAPDPSYMIALQQQAALKHEADSFNQKMSLAEQHGLHPLAVLGAPATTLTPAIPLGDSRGVDFSSIGSGVERIAKTFVKPPEDVQPAADPRADRMVDANLRLAEANAQRAEWDALRSQWTTQDLLRGQPGNPPALRTSNDAAGIQRLAAEQAGVSPNLFSGGKVDVKQDVLPPHPSILGHGLGADQSFIRGVDQHGNFYSVLNPNLIQADFEQGATITALSKIYGPERAIEIAAVLEQAGPIGAAAAGIGYAGKKLYDYFGKQGRSADARRGYGPGRGRGSWRARPGSRNE